MSLPRSISAITLVADKFGLGGRAGLSRLDFVGFDSLCEACCGTEEFRQEEPSSQPALFSFSRIDVTLPPSAVRARFSVGFRIIANFSAPLSFRFRRPVGSPYARASGTLGAKGELRTG
ncbi:MAG: hypothetical protein F4Y34_05315, partial [Gammaproteobacteria bacterium]|nr:hypothetical protein [Gammaproteobacteria bacterium]